MHYHEAKGKLNIGQQVFICDLRYNDIDNKPIRHIKPQKVQVFGLDTLPKNKNVYYSDHYFKPVRGEKVTSQIIAPYDNTGYRAYTGVSLNIFFTEDDCKKHYKVQCQEAIGEFEKAKVSKIKYYNIQIEEIINELNIL